MLYQKYCYYISGSSKVGQAMTIQKFDRHFGSTYKPNKLMMSLSKVSTCHLKYIFSSETQEKLQIILIYDSFQNKFHRTSKTYNNNYNNITTEYNKLYISTRKSGSRSPYDHR